MSDERDPERDQPVPQVNDRAFIQDLVIADIEERKEFGVRKYGTALQSGNGRDMLLDAYEEALDLAIYLRGMKDEDHHLALELASAKSQRSRLREVCFVLAAPLGYGTDGTTASAIHHITSYVEHLQTTLDKIAQQVEHWDEQFTEDDETGGSINPFYLINDLRDLLKKVGR